MVKIMKEHILNDEIDIILYQLNNEKEIKAKVDTGASICSLHVDSWIIDKTQTNVNFMHDNKKYTFPLKDVQDVKSANGTDTRPVIHISIMYNGKLYKNIEFNLANRKEMSHPILLGKNFLEKDNFLIDPTPNKSEENNEELNTTTEIPITKEEPDTFLINKMIHSFVLNKLNKILPEDQFKQYLIQFDDLSEEDKQEYEMLKQIIIDSLGEKNDAF